MMQDYYDKARESAAAAFHSRLPDYDSYQVSWNAFHEDNRGDRDELDAIASDIINRDVWRVAYALHSEITKNAVAHSVAKAFSYAMHRTIDVCAHSTLMTIKWYIPRFSPAVKR